MYIVLDPFKLFFGARMIYKLFPLLFKISSYGQNLQNSTYKGETLFCILICLLGLVFFSHLIGNMQVISLWVVPDLLASTVVT
jgi:cyclic nucleotide gated channel, plant